MNLTLELEPSEKQLFPSHVQLDISLLSQIAGSLAPKSRLQLEITREPLNGLGSSLQKGIICARGNIGAQTANGMKGGMLCIQGDVEQISNVFGGYIYVDGNIGGLLNIHHSARIYCSGAVGKHLYRSVRRLAPSSFVYCRFAPRNELSFGPKENTKLSGAYHYLVQVHVTRKKPVKDMLNDPINLLRPFFEALEEENV